MSIVVFAGTSGGAISGSFRGAPDRSSGPALASTLQAYLLEAIAGKSSAIGGSKVAVRIVAVTALELPTI
jgi:hypothetical protein